MFFKRLWLLVLLMGPAFADPEPVAPITYRQIDLGNGVEVHMINRLGCDMTVTLEFTEQLNVVGQPPLPCSMTIPGHQEVSVARITQADPQKAYRYQYKYYWNYGSLEAVHDNSVVYSLPFAPGQSMSIIQGFHGKFSHTGDDEYALDFSFPSDTPILAAREGTVVTVEERYSKGGTTAHFRNRVNNVRIRHSDGTLGEYDHLRQNGAVVSEGQQVKRGELIGYSGSTGFSSGPHLHFCVYSADNGHTRHSYPIKFRVAGSQQPVELEQGRAYGAP